MQLSPRGPAAIIESIQTLIAEGCRYAVIDAIEDEHLLETTRPAFAIDPYGARQR